MKKISLFLVVFAFLSIAVGCSNNNSDSESTEESASESEEGTPITIPDYSISSDYYKNVLPFEPSESRGLTVSNIENIVDVSAFEEGLMRISQQYYPTDQYYYDEGKYLDAETTEKLLSREMTAEQLAAEELTEEDNIGLNPVSPTGDPAVPMYLSHILEQDYLIITEDGNAKLGGITIGLAMNSVYYYDDPATGLPKEVKIDDATLVAEGQRMAQEILNYLRTVEGLEEVPITFAIYKQTDANSVVPGNFVAVASVGAGESSISSWNPIDEDYYLFPSNEANEKAPNDYLTFMNFKDSIEEFFPNYSGIIGTGFYQDGVLTSMKIEITMQFYSESEVISFTQYVADEALKVYPDDINLEIIISSTLGQEALIVREPGEEPFVYIY